jgi:hypothetical protein
MLRRTKDMRGADGAPIVALPRKHTRTIRVALPPDERAFHDAVRDRARAEFSGLEVTQRGRVPPPSSRSIDRIDLWRPIPAAREKCTRVTAYVAFDRSIDRSTGGVRSIGLTGGVLHLRRGGAGETRTSRSQTRGVCWAT